MIIGPFLYLNDIDTIIDDPHLATKGTLVWGALEAKHDILCLFSGRLGLRIWTVDSRPVEGSIHYIDLTRKTKGEGI